MAFTACWRPSTKLGGISFDDLKPEINTSCSNPASGSSDQERPLVMSFVAGAKIPSQQQQLVLDARQARQCAGREARQGTRQSNAASPAIRDGGSGKTTISAINRAGEMGTLALCHH